jgi:hypothetical protein
VGHVRVYPLPLLCQRRTPMVVEVARAPLGAFTLSESSSDP